MESFTNGLVGYSCTKLFTDKTLRSFTNFLRIKLFLVNGRLQVQGNRTHQDEKFLHRKSSCFMTRTLQNCSNFITWNPVFNHPLCKLSKVWLLPWESDTITAKDVSQLKCLKERRKKKFTWQIKNLVLPFITDSGHILGKNFLLAFGVIFERKESSKTWICLQHCEHTLSEDIHKPDWVKLCWCYKGSIAALLCHISKLEARKL